jgi:hypothetical protein
LIASNTSHVKRVAMPEPRVVVDPHEVAYLERRAIDSRCIKQIRLVATDSEPPIQGYATERVLPASAWRATNNACYDVLGDLSKIDVGVRIAPGVGLEGLVNLAMSSSEALVGSAPGKVRAYVQFKAIDKYPPDRGGPRQYSLLTIADETDAAKSEVLVLGGEYLLPRCDLAGTPLVIFQPDPALERRSDEKLRAHLVRNRTMWKTWCDLGVSQWKSLRVDFFFKAKEKLSADRLAEILKGKGFSVTTRSTRRLFLLKEWTLEANEFSWWTLDRLQWRTIELCESAAKHEIDLEGIGAMVG